MLNKKIQVHKFLGEVFGRETTTFDLWAIIISSVSFAVLTLFVKWNADITIIKKIICKLPQKSDSLEIERIFKFKLYEKDKIYREPDHQST